MLFNKILRNFSVRTILNNNFKNNSKFEYSEIYSKKYFFLFYSYFKLKDFNQIENLIKKNIIDVNYQNISALFDYYNHENVNTELKDIIKKDFLTINNDDNNIKNSILIEFYYNNNNIDNLKDIQLNNLDNSIYSKLIKNILNLDKINLEVEDLDSSIINSVKVCILNDINNEELTNKLNEINYEKVELYDLNIIMHYLKRNDNLFFKYKEIESRLVELINSFDFDLGNLDVIVDNVLNNKNNFSSEIYFVFNEIVLNNLNKLDNKFFLKYCYNMQSIYRLNQFLFDNLIKINFKNDEDILIFCDILRRRKNNEKFLKYFKLINKDIMKNSDESLKITYFFCNYYFCNLSDNNIILKFNFVIKNNNNLLYTVNLLNDIWEDWEDIKEINKFKLYFNDLLQYIINNKYFNNEWIENVWAKIII